MKIILNNKETEFKGGSEITVTDLFTLMKFSFPMIIVKINGKLVKKEEYESTVIRDGDNVTALHLISGG